MTIKSFFKKVPIFQSNTKLSPTRMDASEFGAFNFHFRVLKKNVYQKYHLIQQ